MDKPKFSKLALVDAQMTLQSQIEHRERFRSQWRSDKTVLVRTFHREVRAGGASIPVVAVIVRRKPSKQP